ncbi:restriction endonuclease subunit S [Chitinibacter fontanus]|uniref:Restriction endonuclease subunit S n=1 Tax=Chitinibacter fontanus TaxID=1737446 RepID=A0A7D5ZIX6_9NEIS|nr:restriction endonuclease subunit S [Chitinibacter fontanus]QLI82649.1 restriction endonuclease subunit S [Chitinibacter fontanus]
MLRYELYKPSGVEWLGEIPSHWEVVRAKRIFCEVSEKGHPNAELLSVTQDKGVIPRDQLDQRVVMPLGQLQTFKLVRTDDFVISLRSFQGGIEYSAYTGLVSPAYTVLRKQRDIHSGYLKYLLKSTGFISELNTSVKGIRQGKNIDFGEMSYSYLPIPAEDEQELIANFLDQKTAEIDTAIAKKQRLIELLQEQKNILINQAVTRSLNPDVPMRDSGVEWIGQIPAHWQTAPLKHVSTVQSGVTLGKSYAQVNSIKSYPYLRVANVQDGFLDLSDIAEIKLPIRHAKNYFLKKADILVTEGGDIDKLGRGACWYGEIDECLHQNHVFAIRIVRAVLPEFVSLITGVEYARRYFTTTANKTTNLASTNKTKLGNLPLLVPPFDEQESILSHCEGINAQFKNLIGGVSNEIESLKEMKSTLIASVVTGKLKV